MIRKFRVKPDIVGWSNLCRQLALFSLSALLTSISPDVTAQVVDDVVVAETDTGYDIEITFFFPLRYQSHYPKNSGRTVEILLTPENYGDPGLSGRFNVRSNLSWDKKIGIPLREIIFDGRVDNDSSLILRFIKDVKFSLKNSSDIRSIVISVTTSKPVRVGVPEPVPIASSDNLITALKNTNPELAGLLDSANQAMLDQNFSQAVQFFTKIREQNGAASPRHVQELLGLAREYNGQLAHAKAEYEQYLNDYPDHTDDTKRVQQRLAALITAPESPKKRLRSSRRSLEGEGGDWDTQFYGSVAQTYFRNEITPEDDNSQLIRSDLSSDLDFIGRARKGDYDFRTQFIGSYREDLLSDGEGGEFLPSIISVEARHTGVGLYGRLGRQSRTTGGVLGRFDGLHLAYEMAPAVTLNSVFGYPVDTAFRSKINTDQELYGVSVDVGTIWNGWDFNTFYITQENAGIKDREAVGGEIRYYDPSKSLFTLIDYDIDYQDLNIFLLIGNWAIAENTTLNMVVDYRNSPILTTTNSIQGQGVEKLDELFDKFSESDLKQLAKDRTADSESVTIGLTQQLSNDWQIVGEMTVTEFGETVSSGGVEGLPGTGSEYFYSTQLIGNGLFFDQDIMILSARYSDTFNADTYSVSSNWRINVSRNFRIEPRIRIDYRADKKDGDTRLLARPFLRIDYRFKKWMKFEIDLGYEWLDERFSGESQQATGYFLSISYRAQF